MRNEPREIRLSPLATSRRPSRGERSSTRAGTAPTAFDEAFASLCDQPSSADEGTGLGDAEEIIRQNQQLVARLITQLETLDRQRQKLSKLLNDVESQPTTLEA